MKAPVPGRERARTPSVLLGVSTRLPRWADLRQDIGQESDMQLARTHVAWVDDDEVIGHD